MALRGKRSKKGAADAGQGGAPSAPITVSVVPAEGAGREETVQLAGVPLGDVLRAAKVGVRGMQFSVNGEPASASTTVPAGARVVATEQARGS